MFINEQTIKEIKERADIVSIASSYLDLEKKGSEYVTICPFHADHDPSLHISPEKKLYKCFVCNAGGDVFKLVQEMEHISFAQAVAKVGKSVGIEVELPDRKQPELPPQIREANHALEQFNEYCHYTLSTKEGREARAYLKDRKFTDELIDEFSIGFACDARRIQAYFQAKNIPVSALIDSGLVREDNPESLYFYSRITIPIHDPSGRLIGFTARTLSKGKEVPKYINTPATILYEKGKTIFNYHRAIKSAKQAGRLILVEGAMDVLGLEKAGIHEGIACLGTAVTPFQIDLIARVQVPVTVFYDADHAGQRAAWHFAQMALDKGIPFSMVKAVLQKDADEIYIHQGAAALKKAVSSTISFAEFAFDYLSDQYNLDNYEDKKAYGAAMAQIIRRSLSEEEQAPAFLKLESLTGLDYQSSFPQRRTDRNKKKNRPLHLDSVPELNDGLVNAERAVLSALLHNPDFIDIFDEHLGFCSDETCEQFWLYLKDMNRTMHPTDPMMLGAAIRESEVRNLYEELSAIEHLQPDLEDFFVQSLCRLFEIHIQDQIDELEQRIENAQDIKEKVELISKKAELIKERNQQKERKEMIHAKLHA